MSTPTPLPPPEGPPAKKGPSLRTIPPGEDRERLMCGDCGFIHYDNPKIVVGAVVEYDGRILMCRRAIEPRSGFWTLPAGYLELNETTAAGAVREAWEEARARIEIRDLMAVYNVPRISQVQMFYRARLIAPEISAGPESLEVKLVTWDEVPWRDLAFPSVKWALDDYRAIGTAETFAVRTNPPGEWGSMRPADRL
ncbi:MAG: NUDIX domain-containing protein [Alphaproteobacteria bacterium]